MDRGQTAFCDILDFGCGPGRDLKVFSELGHVAVGLEGAEHFAMMARTHSGCEVWQQDFLNLDLPDNHFDGVYANASLFHVPSQELPRVLLELHASLKPGGVLFCSIGATARIMISILGAAMCQPRDFLSLITITAPSDCHAKNSLG